MIISGSKYENNKSMLADRLNDPFDITVVSKSMFSEGHGCYFCGEGVEDGKRMFRILHRWKNSSGGVNESKYYIDSACMAVIRDKR